MPGMASTRATTSYVQALHRNQDLFSSPSLQRDVPRLLAPEEEVLLVVPGTAGEYPEVMIATDRRFLLAKVSGPVRGARVLRELPAAEVAEVSYRPGLLTRIVVRPHRGRPIRMCPHRRENGERFARELAQLLRTGHLPGPAHPA